MIPPLRRRRSFALTLWACLVLLLLLASPDGVEGAVKKKKKKKSVSVEKKNMKKKSTTRTTSTTDGGNTMRKKESRPSRREVDLNDDASSRSSSSYSDDRAGAAGGSDAGAGAGAGAGGGSDAVEPGGKVVDNNDDGDGSLSFRKEKELAEPLPETRADALVFHSESVPESSWSWRATKRRAREAWDGMSVIWNGISSSADDIAEKLHLPSKREREMVAYYAKLIGSRIKAQWDAIDWDQLAEEVPEIKGFRKTWSEFQNVTGFNTGWKSAMMTPMTFLWTACKWTMAFFWALLTSPVKTVYSLVRWLTSTWWSTLLSLFFGYVFYNGTEVKLKVTPAGMPPLPEGAVEFQRLPKKGYYTLDNFPKNMRGRQLCAKDVWACVVVNKGKLRYKALADMAPYGGEDLLDTDKELTYLNGGAVVPPQVPFEIAPVDGEKKLQFRIVYYKEAVITASPADRGAIAGVGAGAKEKPGRSNFSFTFGGKKRRSSSSTTTTL